MKKLRLIFCLLLLSISLAGCGFSDRIEYAKEAWEEAEEEVIKNNKFYSIDAGNGDSIYIDKETRVQYLFIREGYGGGLTVLVDADGKPILYEGGFE